MSTGFENDLRELLNGYRNTALVYVAAKLDIADLLANGPADAQQLSNKLRINEDSFRRFLRSLAVLGLVTEDEDGKYGLTKLGSGLRSNNPHSLRNYAIVTGEQAFPAWGNLRRSLEAGESAFACVFGMSVWEHRERNPEIACAFNDWLRRETSMIAASILNAYDFSGFDQIADVGGGEGGLLIPILQAYPKARGLLLDLAYVHPTATARIRTANIQNRCQVQEIDFLVEVPAGPDLYLLKSVLHDWNDESARQILRNCRRAMSDVSRLLIIERILSDGVDNDTNMILQDLHMLVMFGGKERTLHEFTDLLASAGLTTGRVFITSVGFQIIETIRRDAAKKR